MEDVIVVNSRGRVGKKIPRPGYIDWFMKWYEKHLQKENVEHK